MPEIELLLQNLTRYIRAKIPVWQGWVTGILFIPTSWMSLRSIQPLKL